MAAETHIELDESIYRARQLKETTRELSARMFKLIAIRDAMQLMIDEDGEGEDDFTQLATLFGVTGENQAIRNAEAELLYLEINSAIGNSAALFQFLAILG